MLAELMGNIRKKVPACWSYRLFRRPPWTITAKENDR
jgi:hypothetical protein